MFPPFGTGEVGVFDGIQPCLRLFGVIWSYLKLFVLFGVFGAIKSFLRSFLCSSFFEKASPSSSRLRRTVVFLQNLKNLFKISCTNPDVQIFFKIMGFL